MFRFTAFSLVLGFASALSCSARYEPDPKFAPASREVEPSERPNLGAMQAIAETRCDQEALCENVGAGKRYPTRAACVATVRQDGLEELGLEQCRAVDPEQLSICKNAVRVLSCKSTPEEVYLLNACQSAVLCSSK